MEIRSRAVLARHGGPGKCDVCQYPVANRERHHCFTVGSGRIDADWNIANLCTLCHRRWHDGNIPLNIILCVVALREKTFIPAIEEAKDIVRRLDKHATPERIEAELSDVWSETARLVRVAIQHRKKVKA